MFVKSELRRIPAGMALCVLALAFAAPAWPEDAPRARPNIVLLFADDLGWKDLACFGSGYYETPNLDQLCREGMKFTSAYSNAGNCAPSRACLLSGQYVPRHGVYTVGGKRRFDTGKRFLKWNERKLLAPDNAKGLAPEKVTMAEALKKAGYTCGMFGKWHLGYDDNQMPQAQGFDEVVLMRGARHFKFNTSPRPKKKPSGEDYLSDYMADRALEFIEKNKERAFFLYLPDFLVHVPLQGKKALVEKYKKKKPVGGHGNPVYAAMIEALDHNFGRIVRKIDDLGLKENTLIIFFSDNGGVGSAKDRGLNRGGKITSVYPLRGMKGMLYEGGIRVPMIARWPGRIKPGSVCDVPVIGTDLYPTFLEAAGAPPPKGQPLDGESLLPLMTGKKKTLTRQDIFWFMPGYLPVRQAPANAMRSGPYKLIENFEDGSLELYNLENDIGETANIATARPAIVNALHQRMIAWRKATGAKVPPRNPKYDPANEGRN